MHPLLSRFLHPKKGDPGPDEIREALAAVCLELETTQERIGQLRDQRVLAIVDGIPYKGIDDLDQQIKHADVDRQRLKISRSRLREMLAEAEIKGRTDRADQIFENAVRRKQTGLDLIREFAEAAARIVVVLEDLEQAEAAIAAANHALETLGDSRRLGSIEQGYWREAHPQYPAWSLLAFTRLPDTDIARRLLWPRGISCE